LKDIHLYAFSFVSSEVEARKPFDALESEENIAVILKS